MSSNPEQIGQAVNSAIKPLKGKYDGRRFNGGHRHPKNSILKTGAKPKYIKDLSRTQSVRTLKALDAIASLSQIYRDAYEARQLALCVQIRDQVENRAFGRPYVATNPLEKPGNASLHQDNRLQLAIQNLVLPANNQANQRHRVTGTTKVLNAAPDTVEATHAPVSPQETSA